MSNLPLPADYVRCLAHTAHKNEWCPHRETCARNITIRHDRFDGSLRVKDRLCVGNEFGSFVDINEVEPEAHCTYPHCNCPFDAPAEQNWCARGLKKGDAA